MQVRYGQMPYQQQQATYEGLMTRGTKQTYEFYVVRPEQASVYVGYSRGDPASEGRKHGLSVIEVTGRLDRAVIRRSLANVSVYEEDEDVRGPGSALGINAEYWTVTLWLPRTQFQHVVTLAVANKLVRIQLVVEGLRRGKGPVVSASFHSDEEPEPDESE